MKGEKLKNHHSLKKKEMRSPPKRVAETEDGKIHYVLNPKIIKKTIVESMEFERREKQKSNQKQSKFKIVW